MSHGIIGGKKGDSFIPSWFEEGSLQEEHLVVFVRALTPEECEKHLKADVILWGYKPVQVTIDNQSSNTYLLSPKSLNLPTAESGKVARAVIHNSISRTVVFKIASFFFWPLSILGTKDSLYTAKVHRSIKKRLRTREVRIEKVLPYTVVHRIFFVPTESYKESFTVSLQDAESLQTHAFTSNKEKVSMDPLPVVEENYYLTHEG